MNKRHISKGALLLAVFTLLPHSTFAYFTTNQTAAKLSSQAAIFTIEYEFGLEDKDIYLPVLAERGVSFEDNTASKVGYAFVTDEETVEGGTSVAIVLSSLPIVDGMYKIEKGTTGKLTFFAILKTPSDLHENDYALHVQKLPFILEDENGNRTEQQLNPSELQYYTTKEIELNTGIFH